MIRKLYSKQLCIQAAAAVRTTKKKNKKTIQTLFSLSPYFVEHCSMNRFFGIIWFNSFLDESGTKRVLVLSEYALTYSCKVYKAFSFFLFVICFAWLFIISLFVTCCCYGAFRYAPTHVGLFHLMCTLPIPHHLHPWRLWIANPCHLIFCIYVYEWWRHERTRATCTIKTHHDFHSKHEWISNIKYILYSMKK